MVAIVRCFASTFKGKAKREFSTPNALRSDRKVSEILPVGIVLSSSWRLDGSLDEIKNQMFVSTSFASLIIDKTPDEDWWRKKKGEDELSPIALAKYGFPLRTRGSEIDYWLRENQQIWNIRNFVILDDCDSGLSERFPDHFVNIYRLLSQADIEKAYEILLKF